MTEWIKKTIDGFFKWIDDLVEWAYDLLMRIIEWHYELVMQLLGAAWDMATDLFLWGVEQQLSVILWLIGQLDFSGIQPYVDQWGSLPGEMLNVLGLLGIGQASLVIIAAIGIRLVLQLIPFTRLGS